MLAKTALLVVSNPSNISKILPAVKDCVNKLAVLYIQLLSSVQEPVSLTYRKDVFTAPTHFSKLIHGIYSQSANHCHKLDVRVLLSGLKYNNVSKICTQNPIELIIFDKKYNQSEVDKFLSTNIQNKTDKCSYVTFENSEQCDNSPFLGDSKMCTHSCLGGTFDHLHLAHKVLLSEAALHSTSKVTVGITADSMTYGKTLWELIEPLDKRIEIVQQFLNDICPELTYDVMPIYDPLGPTQHDASMELLVVSKETSGGGKKVNEVRQSKNLPLMEILEVDLVEDPHRIAPEEEDKVSSSTERKRLLGTVLKPVVPNPNIPHKPYRIGLTGGIASGKTNVANDLRSLGALVIDCDTVAHQVYNPGTDCHKAIVNEFGKEILSPDGTIDRKKLGPIVFGDKSLLQKLNSLVWPAIAQDVEKTISNTSNDIVIIDAAILMQAGWQSMCHEIWAMIIPYDEAVKRLVERNGFTVDQAKQRVDAQPPTVDYVKGANVILCSKWSREYTRKQVEKAWNDLHSRVLQNRL